MDINIGDELQMKKKHPCGTDIFIVNRIGMDFKLVCKGCSHEIIIPRKKAEKNIKKIIKKAAEA